MGEVECGSSVGGRVGVGSGAGGGRVLRTTPSLRLLVDTGPWGHFTPTRGVVVTLMVSKGRGY